MTTVGSISIRTDTWVLGEAFGASVRGTDSKTQLFWHPWPTTWTRSGFPSITSGFILLWFWASEPGLSQPTHFSFAAETGGWSFLSLNPGIGSDCALRRSSREWDYIVGILSRLFRYFWGYKNSIITTLESSESSAKQPWLPCLKYSRQKRCHKLTFFIYPGGLEAKNRIDT